MRKWTQFIKMQISESIKQEVTDAYAKELPSQEASNGSFTTVQRQEVEERINRAMDIKVAQKYQEVHDKATLLCKMQVPEAFIEAQKAVDTDQKKRQIFGSLASKIAGRFGQEENKADDDTVSTTSRLQGTLGRRPVSLVKDATHSQKDKEVDWRDKLRDWRKVQMSSGAVNSLAEKNQSVFQTCSVSVLGCLQASFTAEELSKKIEESLVNGLRRSAGLHLIRFAMDQTHSPKIFYDMLQWFQGSLRSNKSKAVHYQEGLDGCGSEAEKGIKSQFFEIIKRILFQLRQENSNIFK